MKTIRDLNLEYWVRIHDMCEGTLVDPWECVKWRGTVIWKHPNFNGKPEQYEFAVAIIEGTPVFVGDEVYSKSGERFDWSDPDYLNQINFPEHVCNVWTLKKPTPKRTFMLNGVELPCPTEDTNAPQTLFVWGQTFYFDNVGDDAIWREAIRAIMSEARDKP